LIDSRVSFNAIAGPWQTTGFRGRFGASVLAAVAVLALSAQIALTQESGAPPSATPAPARIEKPGLIESIGRWFDQGAASLRTQLRGAKERLDRLNDDAATQHKQFGATAAEVGKSAADATKNAVDAVAKLPTARVMAGQERCTIAPNGAPDCLAAAERLCRKHGFASGKSVDFTSAQECPARVWISGRRTDDECRTVTFITRAMCQ
jgi:hypothetical protein